MGNSIQKILSKLLSEIGAEDAVIAIDEIEGGDIVRYSVETGHAQALIGSDGKNLMALNYIVKKIAERGEEGTDWQHEAKKKSFIIDVNDYQGKRIAELKSKARIMAERARYFKSDVEMTPMSPYERMIVHSFFSDTPDIKTESVGRGKERRIVLKYTEAEPSQEL